MKRPTRRKRSKEVKTLLSPYTIACRVYGAVSRDVSKMLTVIYNEQVTEMQSPNFFYKGETYIIKNSLPVNSLAVSLRPDLDNYLQSLAAIESVIKSFKFALSRLISSGVEYPDLYYVFPESAHQYLEGIEPVPKDPDYVADILSKPDIAEVQTLVKEQALYEMI